MRAWIACLIGCAAPAATPAVEAPSPFVDPPAAEAPAVLPPAPEPSFTLLAAGDVIPHQSVQAAAARHAASWGNDGYDWSFALLAPVVREADVAVVNLETPIAPNHDVAHGSKIFNAQPSLVAALRDAGFDGVSLANNHAWDQGRRGLVETVGHLESAGVPWVGAGRDCAEAREPWLVTRNGITVGFIGATRLVNADLNREPDEPCVNLIRDERLVIAAAAEARAAGAEAVVLLVHWGQEYETAPRSWEVTLAHRMLEGGVDVIAAHHPHVLQTFEAYVTKDGRRTFVAYSLGNLLSGQGLGYELGGDLEQGLRRDGGLLRVTFAREAGRVVARDARVEPTFVVKGERLCARDPEHTNARVARLADLIAEADAAKAAATTNGDGEGAQLADRCARLYAERQRTTRATLGQDAG